MLQDHEKTSEIGTPSVISSISDHYPPQSAPNYAPQGESNVSDGSEPIFSMYWAMVSEEDKKMVEGWKTDADRILIFTGLFSSTVTTLIAVSIQDIRPNSQDTTNFYLTNIYQVLADTSPTNASLPLSPPPFSPAKYAVWVNTFWFLSLVISLTCALLASLLQQWARRYLRATQQQHHLHKRARVRTFFAEGVEKFHLPWAFDALPMLLHTSLFLFFAGLVMFLWRVDHTIFKLVLSLVGVCMALYGCITVMPLFRHDCPYYTPLTSLVWSIVTGTPYVIFWVLRWFTNSMPFSLEAYNRFWTLEKSYHNMLSHRVLKTAEETALSSPPEIDARAFLWTFKQLDGDHQLERFFSGFPGFRNSDVVNDPLPNLTENERLSIFEGMFGLLDRTLSSDLLPQSVKNRRADICAKALELPEEIPYQHILKKIASENQYRGLKTAEFGHIVRGWGDGESQGTSLVVQAIVTGIVARAPRRDGSWLNLASKELGVQERVLQDYAARDDDLSLIVLIHVIRQQFGIIRDPSSPQYALSVILKQASRFNVQITSLELRHGFCTLWNQIVREAQDGGHKLMAWNILRCIRDIYIALHQNTISAPTLFSASTGDDDRILSLPSSYPSCNVSGHCQDSPRDVLNIEISAIISSTLTASVSLSSAVTIQHTADHHTPSDVPDVSLSPSPALGKTAVSKNMPPSECQSSVLTLASPGTSPLPISADLGAGGGNTAAPDHRPQLPSPSPVTDLAIAGPSRRSPDIEHTGGHLLHPSHSQYGMV